MPPTGSGCSPALRHVRRFPFLADLFPALASARRGPTRRSCQRIVVGFGVDSTVERFLLLQQKLAAGGRGVDDRRDGVLGGVVVVEVLVGDRTEPPQPRSSE